jgi:hypothetical protein
MLCSAGLFACFALFKSSFGTTKTRSAIARPSGPVSSLRAAAAYAAAGGIEPASWHTLLKNKIDRLKLNRL